MNHFELDDEYFDYCKRQMHLSDNTLKSYTQVIKQFWEIVESQFDISEITDFTKNDARNYLRIIGDMFKPSSVKHHFGIVKKYFSYLEEIEIIPYSPFESVKARLKSPKKPPETMTIDDVKKVLTAVYAVIADTEYEAFIYYRDCVMIEFLFGTGMRIQELCDLSIDDIDFQNGTAAIVGKGLKYRKLYFLSERFEQAYTSYLQLRKNHLKSQGKKQSNLFLNRVGDALSTQSARNVIEKYVKAANLGKHVTPHTFRHTFASLMLEQGVSLRHIQMYLGHSSIATTQIYLHISEDNAREVIRKNHPRNLIDVLPLNVKHVD